MKVSSNFSAALSLAASASSLERSTRSTLLRTRNFGAPLSLKVFRIACVGSLNSAFAASSPDLPAARISWRASISSASASASPAAPQAEASMARSSRRLGANRPGVSTKMICVAPSTMMPRTAVRVVCALRETMETFEPTSALSSVDLPAFGAPMSATKPHRVSLMARSSASRNACAAACSAARFELASPDSGS